jgi:hypothetical protein
MYGKTFSETQNLRKVILCITPWRLLEKTYLNWIRSPHPTCRSGVRCHRAATYCYLLMLFPLYTPKTHFIPTILHLNLGLPSSSSLQGCEPNFVRISHLLRACYTLLPTHSPWFYRPNINDGTRGSSVSIVSGYGLDDRAIRFNPRQRQRIFPLTSVCRPALGPT